MNATLLLALSLAAASPAQENPAAPIRVSGGVMAGYILTKVMPVVPQEAREQHVSGAVVLHAIVGRDGHIRDLTYVSGPVLLRQAALDAVSQWTYRPYLLNGEAVEVDVTVTVIMHSS